MLGKKTSPLDELTRLSVQQRSVAHESRYTTQAIGKRFRQQTVAAVEAAAVHFESAVICEKRKTNYVYLLGSVIHSSTSCELVVNRRLERDEFAGRWCVAADTCAKRRRSESFAHWSSLSCCIPVRPGI